MRRSFVGWSHEPEHDRPGADGFEPAPCLPSDSLKTAFDCDALPLASQSGCFGFG
jgi:hypothetical protein